MEFESLTNKWFVVNKDVALTETIDTVITRLDGYFRDKECVSYVTSGKRLPEDQLRIIKNYAKQFGVDKEFPEIVNSDVHYKISYGTEEIYAWQRAWSRLLNKGVVINPPIEAVCLFDYYKNGVNKKGQLIPPSSHFYGGAFDIGGKGGDDPTPSDELEIISGAMAQDSGLGIKSFLLERANNCLHVNCK